MGRHMHAHVFALYALFFVQDAAHSHIIASAGRQAEVINAMIDDIKMMTEGVTKVDSFEQLKVLIGHSPLQVLAGAILGIVIGLLVGIMM